MKFLFILILFMLLTFSCHKTMPSASGSGSSPNSTITLIDTVWVPVTWQKNSESIRHYSFVSEGIIDTISVKIGTRVKKGDQLARLISSNLAAKIASQNIVVESAIRDLKRVSLLFEKQASTVIQKEEAQQILKIEKAHLEELRAEQKNFILIARNSGTVISIQYQSGEFYEKGKAIIGIAEGSQLALINERLPATLQTNVAIPVKIVTPSTSTIRPGSVSYSDKRQTITFTLTNQDSDEGIALVPITGNTAFIPGLLGYKTGDIFDFSGINNESFTVITLKTGPQGVWVQGLGGKIKPIEFVSFRASRE